MHLNQGINSILEIHLYLLIGFSLSTLLVFLISSRTVNELIKSIIINILFYCGIFLLYQLSIRLNLNIAVFSKNRNEEPLLLLSIGASLLFLSFGQIKLFKQWLNKKSKLTIVIANLLMIVFLLIKFYPKSYVRTNILNYQRVLFVPHKSELRLFDGSIVKIDTACSSFNNFTDSSENHGVNFRIPIRDSGSSRMIFGFKLLDKSLEYGTSENGSNCKVLPLRKLKDSVVVLFKQKNPNKNIGWKEPLITDTLYFKKVRLEEREPGYYGDTNCDCIQH